MKTIDLRSDTVTRPTQAMRAAMADAVVGDDVFGDDPTVNELQARSAEMLGTEAALFVPSGTQCNLVALLSHCERGDEYIVGQQAHTFKYEGGGAAVLGSIQPQPLEFERDGSLNLDNVTSAIKPDDNHFARTRLLCLENTQGGKVLPLAYIEQASAFAQRHGLGLHLDGARVFNAAVKLDISVQEIAQHFDSVAFCLSKGLGAPVGSVLCGTEASIKRAHRWRKVLGGGMRQAGILAAAGLVALNNHVERLAEDHANARQLADDLASVDELEVDPQEVQTNMVFVSMNQSHCDPLAKFLRQHGILIASGKTTRLVTHLDVTTDDVQSVVKGFKDFFARGQ
ncbi:MAG: low-specificity L-threonine aldolase [Gammaproteobacteria bacterium]|jgi:threonine aldolase|nr:low-specificity L-threonine aldolase [Gammaproteobacteria bacterium]